MSRWGREAGLVRALGLCSGTPHFRPEWALEKRSSLTGWLFQVLGLGGRVSRSYYAFWEAGYGRFTFMSLPPCLERYVVLLALTSA